MGGVALVSLSSMENVDDNGAIGNDCCAGRVSLFWIDTDVKHSLFWVSRFLVVAGWSSAVCCLHCDDKEES